MTQRHPIRLRATAVLWIGLLLLTAFWNVTAQESPPSEFQLKAAYIFNFAKFVEWPADTFTNLEQPIVIGVLGESPFGESLASTIRNKTISGRSITNRTINSIEEARHCQILFITESEKLHWPEIFAGLHEAGVLTVSDIETFTETGGMIKFELVNRRIRFEINDKAAKESGLKISSKLLELAVLPAH